MIAKFGISEKYEMIRRTTGCKTMQTFRLSDLSRRTADVTHAAARAPVTLTDRDKPRFVVLAIEDYEALKSREPDTLPPEIAQPFLTSLARGIDEIYRD